MSGVDPKEIDAIAVTQGPGLEPALWVGISFAKDLAEKWSASRRIPLIPVNHMEGHILSVLLPSFSKEGWPKAGVVFPAIALLISGGHTQLVKVDSWGSYEVIGGTVDDAVGEAFDKVARILGLPYPGGPEISTKAKVSRSKRAESSFTFPRPMLHSKDLNFSFSGLKTSVLYTVQKLSSLDLDTIEDIAHGFEDAVTEVLIKKTLKAIEEIGAETLIIGGGVISNTHIREAFEKMCAKEQISLHLSLPAHATDNAVMIASAGYITHLSRGVASSKDFRAQGNLKYSNPII
jgi:N6-L-threonylcarbamoyladenine synthase